MINKEKHLKFIQDCASQVRNNLQKKYGYKSENMMGKCIEASDKLVYVLKRHGYSRVRAKQVWVLYQNFETCSNYCFEEHWIVEVGYGECKWYVDTTMDQFSWAFDFPIPPIWIGTKLPTFMLPRRPGKTTLQKCGWTDWYNTGNYVNDFEYRL